MSCSPNVDVETPPAGPAPLEGEVDVTDYDGSTRASTDEPYDYFQYVSGLGDIDGDGCDDFALSGSGGYGEETGFTPVATVLYGEPQPARERRWSAASTKIYGVTSGEVLGVGDLDGDGFPELALQTEHLGLRIFRGGPRSSVLQVEEADLVVDGEDRELLLPSAAHGGDVTGDGFADLVFGRYGDLRSIDSPTVYVIPGGRDIFSTSPLHYERDSAFQTAGLEGHVTPAALEDLNADGTADLVLTADNGDGSQVDVLVYLGGPTLTAGAASASPFAVSRQQQVYRVSSLARSDSRSPALLIGGAPQRLWTDLGEAPAELLLDTTASVISIGDLDGDGLDDMLAHDYRTASVFYGSSEFSSAQASPDAILHFPAEPLEILRSAPIGDFNCDGFDDLAVARSEIDSHTNSEVYIIYGAPR